MARRYNPGSTTIVPNYLVHVSGNRFFIPAYPEPHTTVGDRAQCEKLSPNGVELVDS